MTDPRIDLRNPLVAGLLAWLIPGAGHLYQRRYFKAAIYSVCILGIFFWSVSLGEAKVVQLRWDANIGKSRRQTTFGFLAQAGIGFASVPAFIQNRRFNRQERMEFESGSKPLPGTVIEEFDTEFTGRFQHQALGTQNVSGRITGTLKMSHNVYHSFDGHPEFEGRFEGTNQRGEPVAFDLYGPNRSQYCDIGPVVVGLDDIGYSDLPSGNYQSDFRSDRRRFSVAIVDDTDQTPGQDRLEGSIPRPLFDSCLAPLSDEGQQHLNGRLGKYYELALVYSWIAGLLNVLAVWDAIQGPAYGYGDEVPEEPDGDNAQPDAAAAESGSPPPDDAAAAQVTAIAVTDASPAEPATTDAKATPKKS